MVAAALRLCLVRGSSAIGTVTVGSSATGLLFCHLTTSRNAARQLQLPTLPGLCTLRSYCGGSERHGTIMDNRATLKLLHFMRATLPIRNLPWKNRFELARDFPHMLTWNLGGTTALLLINGNFELPDVNCNAYPTPSPTLLASLGSAHRHAANRATVVIAFNGSNCVCILTSPVSHAFMLALG